MKYLKTLSFIFCMAVLMACQEETIELTSYASLKGQVTNQAGSPLADVEVSTVPPTTISLTDSSGHFHIADIPSGEYTIFAETNSYQQKSVKLLLNPDESTFLAIILKKIVPKQGSIKGIVRDAVTFLPISKVSLSTDPATTVLLTDDNGEFRLDSLALGDYELRTRKLGYISDSVSVAVNGGKKTDVELLLTPISVNN